MNTKQKIKIYIIPILCIGLLVAFDQVTKLMVRGSFALHESRPLIQNVFHLTYIQNTGIAWGMFKNGRIIFLILTIAILLVCACVYAKLPQSKRFLPLRICLVVLVSGAIGNMIDRIYLHYVVDFFDFRPYLTFRNVKHSIRIGKGKRLWCRSVFKGHPAQFIAVFIAVP